MATPGAGRAADGNGAGVPGRTRSRGRVTALLLACHPGPTVAVTAISAGLALLAALPPGSVLLVTAAVLAGQLSIGWSNDWLDAARDAAVHRADKPVAAGAIAVRTVRSAAVAALLACVALSAALGWRAAAASLTVVACGWGYNLGLKATAWSWAPYAIAFGSLPAIATLARPEPAWPAGWAVAAGALFGVSAHLANVLPDLTADEATGVRGLPHRIGARATAVAAPALLWVSSMVLLFATGAGGGGGAGAGNATVAAVSGGGGGAAWRLAAAAVLTLVAVLGAVVGWRNPGNRLLFAATVLIVVANVVLFGISGADLA